VKVKNMLRPSRLQKKKLHFLLTRQSPDNIELILKKMFIKREK